MNKQTVALIALFVGWILAADIANATTYEDIAGQWCGDVTDYVFTPNTLTVKFHDNRPANEFKITKYTYTNDSVRIDWVNADGKESVTVFAEFGGNKMAQQGSGDKPRRAFHACSRSSALLSRRRGCLFAGGVTMGIPPLTSSTPRRRIRLRLAMRDQFTRPDITHFLATRALYSKAAGETTKTGGFALAPQTMPPLFTSGIVGAVESKWRPDWYIKREPHNCAAVHR